MDLTKLTRALPSDILITDPEECAFYASDWTKTPGTATAVVLPRSTEEVQSVLKFCSAESIPVVPSGGRTGLAGGAVATPGSLVLSLSRMNRLGTIDEISRSVRVQAGATTEAIHEHARPLNLTWPIDLAAKGSCHVGGNLSTNAGGVRVIRYGMARKWVTALQAVTMSGEVLELNHGLEKNNTGYDLLQLLIGSEGTLAVITEATLKLARLPKSSDVLFFAVPQVANVNALFRSARQAPFDILAFEFFSHPCLQAVEEKLKRKSRLSQGGAYYCLIEIEDSNRETTDRWLESILSADLVTDGLLADSTEVKRAVWELREGITESLSLKGPVKKYDTSVPVSRTAEFLERVEALHQAGAFQMALYLFGHLGDGSPHINLLKPEGLSASDFEAENRRFEKALYPLLKEFHGSVSAEHGVGLLKTNWVTYSRSPEEIRLFKAIKQAFDPKGLLNPGKVLAN